MRRVILIVLDSVGIGALPDAGAHNDAGADTLGNLYRTRGRLKLPNLALLGLGLLADIGAEETVPIGGYGKMAEQSAGKDTTSGHWEITGIIAERPFPTYPDGFPPALIAEFEKRIGTRETFADCGQTIAEFLDAGSLAHGQSFKKEILDERL